MRVLTTDISAEAIGSGLARDLLRHYAANEGPILPRRTLRIDDCSFELTVIIEESSGAIEQILVTASQIARRNDGRRPEFAGARFGVTSHLIDLDRNKAQITTREEQLSLTEDQHTFLREAVAQLLQP